MSLDFPSPPVPVAAPAPAPVADDWGRPTASLRAAGGGDGGSGIGESTTDRDASRLVRSIKAAVSAFYRFAETDRAFPPFPAQFVIEPGRLRVRFPSLVAVGLLERGDDFCGLLATVAGMLGVAARSQNAGMKELLVLAADGRDFNPSGSPRPRVGLRIVSAAMAELCFESDEL